MICYILALATEKDAKVWKNFVQSIEFFNQHYETFKNTLITFTDDARYALKIKDKALANTLCHVVQISMPKVYVSVINHDDTWERFFKNDNYQI